MMTTILRLNLRFGTSLVVRAVCGLILGGFASAHAQTPQPLIVADFNHDGIPDALVLSTTSPTATIAFGTVPYGTFSGSSKVVTFPAGCSSLPQGTVLAGDFNGDGFADLAFFCGEANGVMLGKGDGTFATPSTIQGIVSSIAVLGDFNHDGKLDIAAVGLNGTDGTFQSIIFLPGNGDGTFGTAIYSQYAGTLVYAAVAVADIDGDGYPDIVAGNFATGATPSLDIFGNNKDGTFGQAGSPVVPSVSLPVRGASAAAAILAGNFFGGLNADLAVPGTGANAGMFLLQNTSSSGTFTFGTPVAVPYAGLTGAMAGKFTGAGGTTLDLAVANGANIAVLANNGTGTFALTYATLAVPSTSPIFAVADANGDGYSDIFTASSNAGTLQLAVNVTTGSATATSQPVSLGIGTKVVSAAWNGNDNLLASSATGSQTVTGALSAATVTSSKNPSTVGDSVTFSASVVPVIAGQTPTGSVAFSDGSTVLSTVALDDTGKASYTTGTLTQATHAITAAYTGDSYYAASISPVLSQVVNHAPAVASTLTWATPAPVTYGTPLSASQLNAVATDANGLVIPGTFVYTPVAGTVLDAGAKVLSVTFTPTDALSFLPATQSVTLSVTQAAPVLTWTTPASITYGTPLSAAQLNAAVAGVAGAALPGSFTYTPAAGAVLAPGSQTLSVSFVPTNSVDYTNVSGSVKLLVTGVTVSSFTPNTVKAGDPATKITLTGAGFTATSVVQVNGTALPTTLVSPTTLTAVVPASYFTNPGILSITVADPTVSAVSPPLSLTVAPPTVAATITAPPTTPPGSQTTVTVALTQPYPFDLTGTLTIGFTRVTTPQLTDPALQFAQGGTTLSFTIPAKTTAIPAIQLQAGTIAGTITVPLKLTAGTIDVTPADLPPVSIVVPPAVPSLSGMTVTRSGDQLTVVIHGFSNTREVMNAKFHFTAAVGAALGTTDLTLPTDTIFNTDWFDTDPSDAYGSTFTYTQIFNTSDGAANVASVDATLTNSVGASATITAK